ncbi:MAG: hypothetical protein NW220_18690 [Leptolyngbyaceae cyanobacterium bins.349]|nr:hypothetical protein [Leptolyngbyaceae cyanobacterium bins.349]
MAPTWILIGELPNNATSPEQLRSPRRALWRGCGGRSRPSRLGGLGGNPSSSESGLIAEV